MALQHRYIPLVLGYMFLMSISPVAASENSIEVRTLLSSIEDYAEDMVDTALAQDAVSSQKLYKNIQKNMDQLYQLLAGAPFDERKSRELLMSYSWLRVITVDIKQHAWIGAAIAANQLSASIIRFLNYPTLRQRDTAWMDYLARELLLLNMEGATVNAQLLDARLADFSETWSRIRTSLIVKDFRNKPLVEQVDKLMHFLHTDKSSDATIATAKELLVFVDKIEQVR